VSALDLALPVHVAMPSSAPMVEPVVTEDAHQSMLDATEKAILLQALEENRYNVSEAARKLGITRMTMRYRMDKHQIKH
jgi:DNA-binding NtrC family response regulator